MKEFTIQTVSSDHSVGIHFMAYHQHNAASDHLLTIALPPRSILFSPTRILSPSLLTRDLGNSLLLLLVTAAIATRQASISQMDHRAGPGRIAVSNETQASLTRFTKGGKQVKRDLEVEPDVVRGGYYQLRSGATICTCS